MIASRRDDLGKQEGVIAYGMIARIGYELALGVIGLYTRYTKTKREQEQEVTNRGGYLPQNIRQS